MNTYDILCDILIREWGISESRLSGDDVSLEDIGIDSLDLLNLVFALEAQVGVKIPIQTWIKARNEGDPEWQLIGLRRLADRIDALKPA